MNTVKGCWLQALVKMIVGLAHYESRILGHEHDSVVCYSHPFVHYPR